MSESGKRRPFDETVRTKCLLWSDRHCCLCGKRCGTDIEIHHIDRPDDNSLDNAIPLCYNCHAEISRYNDEVPMGSKYKPEELKTRREQIYERYTRHLVPPIDWQVTQLIGMGARESSPLPRVGFNISHLGDILPAKAKIRIKAFLAYEDLGVIRHPTKPYYSEGIPWNLNPRHTFFGNFGVPKECGDSNEDLKLEVKVTLIDIYERPHELLPICYTFVRDEKDPHEGYWFAEPTTFSELRHFKDEPMKYN